MEVAVEEELLVVDRKEEAAEGAVGPIATTAKPGAAVTSALAVVSVAVAGDTTGEILVHFQRRNLPYPVT